MKRFILASVLIFVGNIGAATEVNSTQMQSYALTAGMYSEDFFLLPQAAMYPKATTHFQVIQKMFEQGSAVSNDQLVGAYSGRCFFRSADPSWGMGGPDDPTGSILVGKVVQQRANDPGPAFPQPAVLSGLQLKLANGTNGTDPGWDDWTEHQAYESFFSGRGKSDLIATFAKQEKVSTSWKTTYAAGYDIFFEARIYNDYIVVMESLKNDSPEAACYFFKKLGSL